MNTLVIASAFTLAAFSASAQLYVSDVSVCETNRGT